MEQWRLQARRLTTLAAILLWTAVGLPGCGRERPPAPPVGITVKPPANGDDPLHPLRFTISNGSSELRDVIVLCLVERIATSTMRLSDNSERVGMFAVMAPLATETVSCEPQVYLDHERIRLESATVAIDLEFLDAGASDRRSLTFTYDAARNPSGRLTWNLTKVTRGP